MQALRNTPKLYLQDSTALHTSTLDLTHWPSPIENVIKEGCGLARSSPIKMSADVAQNSHSGCREGWVVFVSALEAEELSSHDTTLILTRFYLYP